MASQETRPVPPRTHSLKIAGKALAAAEPALSVAFDFGDGNEEKKRSETLVLEANDALQRVDDGWSADELRGVVTKLVDHVQRLTGMLVRLQEAQAELETSLVVTKSNLTLALSNTEMLEEALQRADSGKGKDIGWRRWSDREGLLKRSSAQAGPGTSNLSNGHTTAGRASEDGSESSKRHAHHSSLENANAGRASGEFDVRSPVPHRSQTDILPSPRTAPPSTTTAPPSRVPTPTPPAASDSGFFSKLRFGGANASTSSFLGSSSKAASSLPALAASLDGDTSASPIDDPAAASNVQLLQEKQRSEELQKLLEAERKAKADVLAQKADIESELEGLSAALFEEANKMVAAERIKRAEAEEELRFANDEKEALRSALRLMESEHTNNEATRAASRVSQAAWFSERRRSQAGLSEISGSPSEETAELPPDSPGVPVSTIPPQQDAEVDSSGVDTPIIHQETLPETRDTPLSPKSVTGLALESTQHAELEIEPPSSLPVVTASPLPISSELSDPAPADVTPEIEEAAAPPNITPSTPPRITSSLPVASPPPVAAILPDPEPKESGPQEVAPVVAEVMTPAPSRIRASPSPVPSSSSVTSAASTDTSPPTTNLRSTPTRLRVGSLASRLPVPAPTSPLPSPSSPGSKPVSSRIAAARAALEAASAEKALKSSPPPPVRIPGHNPRLPRPSPSRTASDAGNNNDEKA